MVYSYNEILLAIKEMINITTDQLLKYYTKRKTAVIKTIHCMIPFISDVQNRFNKEK